MRRLVTCMSIVTFCVFLLTASLVALPALGGGVAEVDGPRITFEKLTHDFGEISPGTKNPCEFKFTNTGNALLKIGKIRCPCGCTVATLAKKDYAPGESGILKIVYNASSSPGTIRKSCSVPSNDKKTPTVVLIMTAKIVRKVEHEPKRLNILLKGENAGCPEITLTSLDKRPFAITNFKSTGDSMTVDYDTLVKATKFVLRPEIDFEKLQKGPRGQVEIGLSHPGCKSVRIIFETMPEFKTNPRVVYVRDAEAQRPVIKKFSILSNYNEDFEIESTSSKKGTVKALTQKKTILGYELELQITPPASDSKTRVFTDVFYVKLKGGQQLQATCYGIYSKKIGRTSR
jgi:hypothetical protein